MGEGELRRIGELLTYLSPWPASIKDLSDDMRMSESSIYRLIERANEQGHDLVLLRGCVLVTSGGFKKAWEAGTDWWIANVS